MSEPDISTLARRLAEQNNVDWRALEGSGQGGKVVERDVLDYLARVMSGEEATNPTAEPLPEGMDAWPDQDLQEVRAGVGEAASLGDLRQELADSVRTPEASDVAGEPFDDFGDVESVPLGGEVSGPEPLVASGSSDDAVAVDEDIFLFGDESPTDQPAAEETAGGTFTSPELGDGPIDAFGPPVAEAASDDAVGGNDDLGDLLVAGDEFDDDEAGDHADGYYDDPAAEPWGGYTAGQTAQSSDGAAFSGVSAGEFGEPDDDLFTDAADGYGADQADDHSAPSELSMDGDAYPAEDATGHDWTQPLAGLEEGEAEATSVSEPDGHTAGGDWGSDIALGGGGKTFATSESDGALWGEPETASATDDLWAGDGESVADPVEAPHDEGVVAGAVDDGLVTDISADDDLVSDITADDDLVTDITADAEAGALAAAGAGVDVTELPLSRSATILRRHIDVSALAASQLSVGNELGFDEPLGVAPFLLRAVAKAAGEIGVASEHVALAVLGSGLELRRVGDAAGRSFGSLVAELSEPAVLEDEPQLVAADLSGLDLDEVLLDLDVPVVTLGRILYDNQRGAYRSTLALSGASQPEAGARLLARVAELLDAPVRLVL